MARSPFTFLFLLFLFTILHERQSKAVIRPPSSGNEILSSTIRDTSTYSAKDSLTSTRSDTIASTARGSGLKFAGFPVLGYAPETRIIGGMYTQLLAGDPGQGRPSSLGISLLVSQNRQFSINLFPEIWMKQDLYRVAGELKWQYWPDKFYGIGNSPPRENEEYYVSRIAGIKLDLMRRVYRPLYAGILVEAEKNTIVEYDTIPGAELPTGSIPGSDYSVISGLGAGFALDTRPDILLPVSGLFYQFRVVYFNGLMGSSHPHFKWILDLRNYLEFGRGHLAYFQFYAKFLGGSGIPFRNMALLGGDKLLRGYFRGRYRDHNMYVIQAEYHSPPLWRLSLVVFGGLGDVYRLPADLRFRESKPSGGIGLRYRVFRDRRLNLRFDAALGRNDGGIYLGIGEAF